MLRTRLLAQALLAPSLSTASGQQASEPNILVIMGDDVGWMNVSSYGGDLMGVAAPNIAGSARRGCG